ncbi:MAG: hypothetical protein ACI3U1_10495, partial [Peptococcaceae bacterium]
MFLQFSIHASICQPYLSSHIQKARYPEQIKNDDRAVHSRRFRGAGFSVRIISLLGHFFFDFECVIFDFS